MNYKLQEAKVKQYARISLASFLSFAIIVGTALPAYAQSSPAAPTQPKTVKFQDACKNIKNRLNIRVGNVNSAKDENTTVYEGLNKRLEKVIEAAKKQQYDTADLTAALAKTRASIESYTEATKAYTTELTATANSVCPSETNYRLAIAKTREALKAAREAGVTTRDAFQYDAIPSLRAYKVWLNEQKESASTETFDTAVTSEEKI